MRTPKVLLTLLGLSATLMAVPLPAQDYPHAFPRTGTTRILDNARVTVWEVNWIHGAKQPIHRHRYDMAGVYLRFGEITVTRPDGVATTGQRFEVPRPYFQVKDITHREEALGKPGDPERLAIMVDLKDVTVPPFTMPAGAAAAFPREGAANVLENERVRMWDYTWPADTTVGPFVYAADSIEVWVTSGAIRTQTADGAETTRQVAPKQARFIPRGTRETHHAIGAGPRAIVIELK